MNLDPIHAEFGARVYGVNLSQSLDDATFRQIDEAVNRYSLLLFENQQMNDEIQLEITRRFGQLEEEHTSYYRQGNKVSARQVKASTGNEMWHSDSSFREIPAMYSILTAYEVPDEAGETEFASARSAYRRLDAKTRELIEGRVGIHDYIYSRSKVGEDAVTQGQRTYMHPVRQRLVRQNPVTGERNVFVGSHLKAIEGMPDDEAQSMIARLVNEVTRPESIYRHRWCVGDFVIWDNRCLLHSGCGYDAEKYRRRMHQTRVRGEMPSIAEPLD
jgi:alpha-ketoglutarate-dependent 2,4-dichlorophenoxyacetate dioxygenase